jgi:hypothetical protein
VLQHVGEDLARVAVRGLVGGEEGEEFGVPDCCGVVSAGRD